MLPHILEKVRFGSLDELYAAIGYGGASAQKCANRAREELVHQDRQQAERLAAERPEKEAEEKCPAAPSALDAGGSPKRATRNARSPGSSSRGMTATVW